MKTEILFRLHAVSITSTLLFLMAFRTGELNSVFLGEITYLTNFSLIYIFIFYLMNHLKTMTTVYLNTLPYILILLYVTMHMLGWKFPVLLFLVLIHLLFFTSKNYYEINLKESIIIFFVKHIPKKNIVLFIVYILISFIMIYTNIHKISS